MADDIYIGGKQLKQSNPPVKPHWSEDPPDTDEVSPDAKMQIGNYSAPRLSKTPAATEGQPNTQNNDPEDFSGMRGLKRKP